MTRPLDMFDETDGEPITFRDAEELYELLALAIGQKVSDIRRKVEALFVRGNSNASRNFSEACKTGPISLYERRVTIGPRYVFDMVEVDSLRPPQGFKAKELSQIKNFERYIDVCFHAIKGLPASGIGSSKGSFKGNQRYYHLGRNGIAGTVR